MDKYRPSHDVKPRPWVMNISKMSFFSVFVKPGRTEHKALTLQSVRSCVIPDSVAFSFTALADYLAHNTIYKACLLCNVHGMAYITVLKHITRIGNTNQKIEQTRTLGYTKSV
jgi:hypothetical protein